LKIFLPLRAANVQILADAQYAKKLKEWELFASAASDGMQHRHLRDETLVRLIMKTLLMLLSDGTFVETSSKLKLFGRLQAQSKGTVEISARAATARSFSKWSCEATSAAALRARTKLGATSIPNMAAGLLAVSFGAAGGGVTGPIHTAITAHATLYGPNNNNEARARLDINEYLRAIVSFLNANGRTLSLRVERSLNADWANYWHVPAANGHTTVSGPLDYMIINDNLAANGAICFVVEAKRPGLVTTFNSAAQLHAQLIAVAAHNVCIQTTDSVGF